MPNEKIYTTELARFRTKYNMPEYNLKTLMEIDQKFRYVNEFLNKDAIANNSANQFVNLMSRTLGMYFEANTSLRADGKYMSGFYPQEFLRDFEKLASLLGIFSFASASTSVRPHSSPFSTQRPRVVI